MRDRSTVRGRGVLGVGGRGVLGFGIGVCWDLG